MSSFPPSSVSPQTHLYTNDTQEFTAPTNPAICSTQAPESGSTPSLHPTLALAGGESGTTVLSSVYHVLLPYFSTAEACVLRLVNKEFCATVSAFPFDDKLTPVPLTALPAWRACLPAARCLLLAPFQPDRAYEWQPPYAAALASLRELHLSSPQLSHHYQPTRLRSGGFSPDAILPSLLASLPATLTSLSLRHTPTGSLTPLALARFSQLRSLDVGGTSLQLGSKDALKPLAALRHLSLASCSFRAAFPEDAFEPLTQLASLDISCTRISGAALAHLPRLRVLRARGCSDIPGTAWASCPQLEELFLDGCMWHATAPSITAAAFAALPRLHTLSIACTNLQQAAVLAPLAGSLRSLDCTGCYPGLRAALGPIFTGGPLRTLLMGQQRYHHDHRRAFDELEASAAALLPLLAQLHTADLSYLRVSAATLRALAAAQPPLHTLCLNSMQKEQYSYSPALAAALEATPEACAALLALPALQALQADGAPLGGAVGSLPAGQGRALLRLLAAGERGRLQSLAEAAGVCSPAAMSSAQWAAQLRQQNELVEAVCRARKGKSAGGGGGAGASGLESLLAAGYPLQQLLLPRKEEEYTPPGRQPACSTAHREHLARLFDSMCRAHPATPRSQHFAQLWALRGPLAPEEGLLALALAAALTLPELCAAAVPLTRTLAAGLVPVAEVYASGTVPLSTLLRSGASVRALLPCGVTLPQLLAAQAPLRQLYSPSFSSPFGLPDMLRCGVGVGVLRGLGATCNALKTAGVGRESLFLAGFSEGDIKGGAPLRRFGGGGGGSAGTAAASSAVGRGKGGGSLLVGGGGGGGQRPRSSSQGSEGRE